MRSRGRGCYQWGSHGKVYCGPGARQKAERQGRAAYAHGYGMREDTSALSPLIASADARYPRAGTVVDGRLVRRDVPNLDSIDGYFADQEELPGIREVPVSDFGGQRSVFYASDDFRRSERLADAIAESGEIAPLIIGFDEKGPFIIEGAHRFVALYNLKARSFPAVVVVGTDD